MESSIIITESVKNQRMPTNEVIKNMKIGDYFMLDKSWIQITENHIVLANKIF